MKAKNRSKFPEQKKLIALIYRKFGGLVEISKKLKVSPQLALFWREQGYVPLKRVSIISKQLKVSPYALNFKGYKEFTGDEDVEWKDVVEKCKLTKEETRFVLG